VAGLLAIRTRRARRGVVLAAVLQLWAACSDASGPADAGWSALQPAAADAAAASGRAGSAARPQDAGAPADRPESYLAVADIVQRSCAYARCHDGPILGGSLRFARGSDFAEPLVDIDACEYEGMKRVKPFDPEHSWIMVKLTADFRAQGDPYADYINFDPGPDWDPTRRGCRDQTDEGIPLFGQRMPATAPNMLPNSDLDLIRAWISEGAPH
jgi:hypothetical protein